MDYGLIGKTLKHSFSVEIHHEFFGYKYELCEVKEEDLERFLKRKDFRGINVTIPYKQAVMKHLDYIDPIAEEIGAVNTIVNRDGVLYGYNTDFYGLKALIEKNADLTGKKVLILGSGGTSNTAKYTANYLNAKEVLCVSRSRERADITYEEMYESHSDADIIINTTPVGMYPDISSSPLDILRFKNLLCVIDAVYNPLCTRLVSDARASGIKAEGGLYMLVMQAAKSAQFFTNKQISEQKINAVFASLYKRKQNIVLIGMPTSGKSSVAKELSAMLSRDMYDTDTLVSKHEGTDIKSIFALHGEPYFRDLEHKATEYVSAKSGVIIATGGGIVLNKKNIEMLKLNGTVYFLDRPLKSLLPSGDRPLSSNKSDLERIYNERYALYKSYADKTVKVIGDIGSTAKIIAEDFLK